MKLLLSYSKKTWDFADYPVKTWKNKNAGEENVKYGAGIIRWAVMVGHGATSEEAIKELERSFHTYRDNNSDLPRPGTNVPLKFATTEQIDKYEEIAVDFFKRVLQMNYYDGFYSDFSCLPYFDLEPLSDIEHNTKMKDEVISRTLLLYHVDITEIYEEPLWKIFATIKEKRQ